MLDRTCTESSLAGVPMQVAMNLGSIEVMKRFVEIGLVERKDTPRSPAAVAFLHLLRAHFPQGTL
ncbi:MAG: hypothetical protein ACREOH_04735 [Candidatus Entotheonellia bacterium]